PLSLSCSSPLLSPLFLFFFYSSVAPRSLHSFPTRRSSDLKPKFSKLLGEYVAADPDAVAKALARCYHWAIAPCGDTALNMLGLRSEEHTSELQSRFDLVCRLLLEKKKI